MRIVYDSRIYGAVHGGILRYVAELACAIVRAAIDEVRILAPIYSGQHLRALRPAKTIGWHLPGLRRGQRAVAELNGVLVKLWAFSQQPQIVHEIYYYRRAAKPRGSKTVLTVYDMIQERCATTVKSLRERWDMKVKAEAIQRADHVICISQHTRSDVLELLNVDPHKVTVIHLGCRMPVDAHYPRLIKEPYLLHVGGRQGYKNFLRVVRAYASNRRLRDNFRLVCLGGGPRSHEESELLERLRIADGQVRFLEGDDYLLASLYTHAAALVYGSTYEGFGLPPLEAMAHGCPVVCSNTSSLPEVVGDAAELFNPLEAEDIAAAVERVVFCSERSQRLQKLGRQRAALFSWEACATKTRRLYEIALQQ